MNHRIIPAFLLSLAMAFPMSDRALASGSSIDPTEEMLADILIRMAEFELTLQSSDLPEASGQGLIPDISDRLSLLESLDPDKAKVVTAPDPVLSAPKVLAPEFVAMSLDGKIIASARSKDLTPLEIAQFPLDDACAGMGPWFVDLSLKRDFQTFFVQTSAGKVRVCRQVNAVWKATRAVGNERAHLIAKPN